MNIRLAIADWLDPDRPAREVAATKRALAYRDAVRRSRPLLLVSEYREVRGMLSAHSSDVTVASVEQAAAGRVRGLVLSGVIPTNLALQHTDYRKAMVALEPCLLTTRVGAGL